MFKRPQKAPKGSAAYRERVTEMLLQEMTRVEPGSPAYTQLLEQLTTLSSEDELSEKENDRKRVQKLLKSLPQIFAMPWWFQVVFISVIIFGLVLFIDAVGLWFDFDLLRNDPPPVQIRRHATHVFPPSTIHRIQ
ncbi:hypothetical protein C1752_14781 [Acaryochloris thomasi RCC1774]|uniref:Uncharacterized protein n=1 Tax=Acaryochloris thomasi RCC1774 TaxID=1764569 RepID=A0A2W1J7X2_9CYAN|nr:hypothetical protein [Acaryochloris thomasi]PZD70276.1 hypothetical protein C1752_14781 [Acaryochloris thomasi RCC1774]